MYVATTLSTVYTRSGECLFSMSLSGSPPGPESAPELALLDPSGETAMFSVNLTDSAPNTSDQEHLLTPVEVVYRIKDLSTQVTRYLAQVSTYMENIVHSVQKTLYLSSNTLQM